tara:strand:+ start:947 stop:1231 length:285 start_codon:yes stop_codon:yes gene_type:complete
VYGFNYRRRIADIRLAGFTSCIFLFMRGIFFFVKHRISLFPGFLTQVIAINCNDVSVGFNCIRMYQDDYSKAVNWNAVFPLAMNNVFVIHVGVR